MHWRLLQKWQMGRVGRYSEQDDNDAKMIIIKLTEHTNDDYAKMTMISTQQTDDDGDDDHSNDDGDDDHNNDDGDDDTTTEVIATCNTRDQ